MAERFIKFIPSEAAFWLMTEKPKAFRLLTHIANTARRTHGNPDGLLVGQCHLQHWTFYKLTEREYRTAKDILVKQKHIIIIETNRTRKKSTTAATTVSTLVQLISSTVYDINSELIDDRKDDRATTDRRQTRRKKNEEESSSPTPSSQNGVRTDDFFSAEKTEIVPGVFLTQPELDACVTVKGSVDAAKAAIEFIQGSKKRKHPISDWPNALANWKIENKTKICLEDNISFAEKLCTEFLGFKHGSGWRCRMYKDEKKIKEESYLSLLARIRRLFSFL